MAEGAQGGLGRPSRDGTNESFLWCRANPTVQFLISVCSTARVVVEGPGHNLGRFSPTWGGGASLPVLTVLALRVRTHFAARRD